MHKVKLTQLASVIRSKNAGPYELTLDILFKDEAIYREVKENKLITPGLIAEAYGLGEDQVLSLIYFDPAWAVKATLVRPLASGDLGETDVYGAQQHAPLLDMVLPWPVPPATSPVDIGEFKRVLKQLTPREQEILEKRFGLKDGRSYTLKELAQEMGADAQEVREAEAIALALVRLQEFRLGGKRAHEKGKLFMGLTPRESFIIRLLLGEEGGGARSLAEIENQFSLSFPRLRSILDKAWRSLGD